MQTFSDPQLDQALGANGYDAMIAQIEKREGRPVADMVDVRVSVELPGATKVYDAVAGRSSDHGGVGVRDPGRPGWSGVVAVVAGVLRAVGWPWPPCGPLRPPPSPARSPSTDRSTDRPGRPRPLEPDAAATRRWPFADRSHCGAREGSVIAAG